MRRNVAADRRVIQGDQRSAMGWQTGWMKVEQLDVSACSQQAWSYASQTLTKKTAIGSQDQQLVLHEIFPVRPGWEKRWQRPPFTKQCPPFVPAVFLAWEVNTSWPPNKSWGSGSLCTRLTGRKLLRSMYLPATIWLTNLHVARDRRNTQTNNEWLVQQRRREHGARGGGGTTLFGLYGDVPLDRVWFFWPRCP